MDPITAAIIAALTSAITEVGKQGVQDAYNALKSVLARKYSARYGLLKAIDDLEKNPNSRKRKAVLQQEVEIANADQDQELLYYAYNLSQQVNRSRSYQIVSGSNNIAQQPGGDAYYASGRGNITKAGRDVNRLGPIVVLVIGLVAIFAVLIWLLFSSAPWGAKSTAAPTSKSIPEYPPSTTIFDLCQFASFNRTDWIYELYTTDSFRNKVSQQDFTKQWNDPNVYDQCTLTNVHISGDTATGDLMVQRSTGIFKYRVTFKKKLTQDSHGNTVYGWQIDDLQPR